MDHETGCPDDYAELFKAYFPMMVGIVAQSGIQRHDVQDVAMDILARFIEKDGISYYDPDHLHDVGESPDLPGARFRKAKFKGMLRGFTSTYVMQYRDKQMTRHKREPWRTETPVFIAGLREPMTWLELNFAETTTFEILDSEVSVSIRSALKKARELLTTKSTEFRDYPRFVDLCIEHGFFDGKINRKAIELELGVAGSTVAAMIQELRRVLRPLLTEVGVLTEATEWAS